MARNVGFGQYDEVPDHIHGDEGRSWRAFGRPGSMNEHLPWTTRSTTTPNTKRGGSRITEPTNYEESLVNQILRDIPMYHGLQHACLIGDEEISVINENYKRSKADR